MVLHQTHDEDKNGHKHQEATYQKIMDGYWWENLWTDVRDYVSSCLECQKRHTTHSEEELYPT